MVEAVAVAVAVAGEDSKGMADPWEAVACPREGNAAGTELVAADKLDGSSSPG